MSRYIIFYFTLLLILLISFSCGSYWFSEQYMIKTTQYDFVNKVDSFKNCNPEYKCYKHDKYGNIIDLDGAYAPYEALGDTSHLHYSISIYLPSEKKMFRCHIVPYDSLSMATNFVLLFSMVSDTNYTKVYQINTKDLSYKENKRYKSIFEKEILNKLGVEWTLYESAWFIKNIVSRI